MKQGHTFGLYFKIISFMLNIIIQKLKSFHERDLFIQDIEKDNMNSTCIYMTIFTIMLTVGINQSFVIVSAATINTTETNTTQQNLNEGEIDELNKENEAFDSNDQVNGSTVTNSNR